MENKPEVEVKKAVPAVPEIYRLISEGASTETIVKQIYTDFYGSGRDLEKVFLAIQELQQRGNEGVAAISYLATGTDELGELFKKIQENNPKGWELEELLGINRFPNVLDKDFESEDEVFEEAYNYAVKKGYTKKTLAECIEDRRRIQGTRQSTGLPPHLARVLEHEILVDNSTFGDDEPKYLETLGPREILRLRSLQSPQFLLLGSYGVYSAREFRSYADKINPNNKSFVVDIYEPSIKQLAGDPINSGKLVQGDARQLSYRENTMDHIYTNKLLPFLGFSDRIKDPVANTRNLLQESLRVLKPGGSLVMVEQIETFDSKEAENFIKGLTSLARRVGFQVEDIDFSYVSFFVRKEVGSSTIDANGFPQYGDSLIKRSSTLSPFCIKLVKP